MTVIDVHTHVLSQDWLQMIEAHTSDYSVRDAPGGHRALYRGEVPFLTLTPAMQDYRLRIKDMDAAGVDVAVVSLTCPNVYWGDAATSHDAARLMNDQMRAAQDRYPDRLRHLASIPWQHPERALAELERACANGAVGVMVLANIDGASLTDPRFSQVWEAIDDRSLPVLVHPATPPGLDHLDMGRFHLVWSVGFTFDTTLALSRMLMDGFFERYRRLSIIASHGGGYLPSLMGRLDAGFRSFPATRAVVDVPPSTYAPRIYADAITYSPDALALAIKVFGPENILFGSDYPHACGRMEETLQLVDGLPPGVREKVRSTNAARLFGL